MKNIKRKIGYICANNTYNNDPRNIMKKSKTFTLLVDISLVKGEVLSIEEADTPHRYEKFWDVFLFKKLNQGN